jgi:polysaccharide export outer membrane protein
MQLLRWSSSRLRAFLFVSAILACALVMAALAQDQPVQPSGKPADTPATTAAPASKPASTTETQPATGEKDAVSPGGHAPLRLGAGDLVEVSVYNVPELASKARIGGSGDVYLPLIDYAHVAGLTTDEAQQLIEKKLSDGGFVKNPHVTIFVDEYALQGASVLGEIARPGVYPVMGQPRLFDVISAAGGMTDKAGNSATISHRDQPGKSETIALAKNLEDIPQSNVEIFPGDTIVIRRADIIYVVGDVARPSGLLIDRGTLTVLQAIALAGGTTRTSRPNSTRIIHKGPNGITEKHVELKKILEAKIPDVPLNPDDILFVPSSTIKLALQDNAGIAMQVASLSLVAVR